MLFRSRLLARIWPALSGQLSDELIQAILKGPSRNMYHDDLADEEWQEQYDRDIWHILVKLNSFGRNIPDNAQNILDSIQKEHANWSLEEGERDEFAHWSETRVGHDIDITVNELFDLPVSELVNKLLEENKEFNEGRIDTFRVGVKNHSAITLQVLHYLSENNIADGMDEDDLREIGREVVDGFDRDLDSRSEWEERLEESLKLAAQVSENKSFPWENAANVKYPLLTTAALQFASRAYPALIPGPNLVKGRVIGFDEDGSKMDQAIRVGKHMSYQLMEEMEDWEEDMDKLCIIIPIVGCAFKKTYYSPLKDRNISELVLAQDLVVDYYAKSLEDSTRITHRLYLNPRDEIGRAHV